MRQGTIICCAIFCPVCKIFNRTAKYIHHIERARKSTPHLRLSLARWIIIPYLQTVIVPTATIIWTLHHHPAQNMRTPLNTSVSNTVISIIHNVQTAIMITKTHNIPLPLRHTTWLAPVIFPPTTTLLPIRFRRPYTLVMSSPLIHQIRLAYVNTIIYFDRFYITPHQHHNPNLDEVRVHLPKSP